MTFEQNISFKKKFYTLLENFIKTKLSRESLRAKKK